MPEKEKKSNRDKKRGCEEMNSHFFTALFFVTEII